ncbi:MAG: hypothetical protein CVV33_09410 [Methanomicrobiales archaeon HGW-Methanomicrobiales-4]|nr:MAG: hypothetical protein CVV33_09410 [Methanomicrobiales archaeon HGW-Methanomicrobiales-4]
MNIFRAFRSNKRGDDFNWLRSHISPMKPGYQVSEMKMRSISIPKFLLSGRRILRPAGLL